MRRLHGLGWIAALGLISVSLAAGEVDDIPLVGLDKDGKTIETSIAPVEYVSRLSTATESVLSSTVEALGKSASAAAKPWKVRTIVVGVGAELEVGVGPILKLKAVPRFRVAFSDSDDPALP